MLTLNMIRIGEGIKMQNIFSRYLLIWVNLFVYLCVFRGPTSQYMPERRRTWSPRWSCRRWPKPLEPTTASTKKLPAASWTVGLRVLWYETHAFSVCLCFLSGRKSVCEMLTILLSSWSTHDTHSATARNWPCHLCRNYTTLIFLFSVSWIE